MSPKQAIPADKINPFLSTRRRPTVDHSLVALLGDIQGLGDVALIPAPLHQVQGT